MRLPRLEATRMGRLFNVPAHIWRALITEALTSVGDRLRGRPAAAFGHWCAALCHAGFIRERVTAWIAERLSPKGDADGSLLAPASE
jgi:hypothetical protein